MSMKRMKFLCVLFLGMCGLSQALAELGTELNAIDSAWTEANVSSVLAATTPPTLTAQHELRWQFAQQQGLSFTSDPSVTLEIQNATDEHISVAVQNDAQASIKAASSGNVLALRAATHSGSKIVLYLPEKTRYLMFKTLNVLQGHLAKNVLYLNLSGCSNVDLQGAPSMLEYLRIDHATHVTLSSIKTPYLLASITDSSDIKIHGVTNVRSLNVRNSQAVALYWLNSPILNLNIIGHSSVLLAGKVVYANMKLKNDARLDAQYLATDRLFVNTADHATAEVLASDALNALATGYSNIYYYKQPRVLSRYNRDSGSVLYQGENLPPCTLPYCPTAGRVLPG